VVLATHYEYTILSQHCLVNGVYNKSARKIMKSILALLIMVLFLVSAGFSQDKTPATGQPSSTAVKEKQKSKFEITWLAIDILPFSPRENSEYSPEYKWRYGRHFAGGGFAEKGLNRNFISRHNIQFKPLPKHLPWFAIRHEVAFNKLGYVMQTGAQVEFTQVPKVKKTVRKLFRSLSVSPTARWAGKIGTQNETQLGWNTKQFKLGPVKVWSEGFERFRGGTRRDFGQWQGWITSDKLSKKLAETFGYSDGVKIAFGFEIENTGWKRKHTPLFGMKIYK
jgi:hypothetical protein